MKAGDTIEYKGNQYKVVQLFGKKNQYAIIENNIERISIDTKMLPKKKAKK